MKPNKPITLFIFFLLLVSHTFPQAYDIKVTINGLSNADLFLAYHYGKKVYVIDTIKTDEQSNARFTGEKDLLGGMYLIYLPDKRYFDFLVSDDQKMQFETDTSDLIGNMKIRGSKENIIFFDFQSFLKEKYGLQSQLRAGLGEKDITEKQKDKINIELESLNKEVEEYWNKLIKKHNGTFAGNFIKANRDVKVPTPDEDRQKTDQLYSYNYLLEHFFDNIDLSDPRLLRTSVLSNRIERYFDRTLMQISDSITTRALWFIEKCRKSNKEVFRFVLQDLLNRYAQPKIMGLDAVYVTIAEKYYLSGLADWISNEDLKMIEKRVNMISPNLIGKQAPDLILESINGDKISLHEFRSKLTLLLFWDHECGHCKETVKVLQKVFEKYSDKGLGIFAVYTMSNIESWKKFVEENNPDWTHVFDSKNITNFKNLYDAWGNPTVYILDKNKKIIAKKFGINQLEKLLEQILKSSTSPE